MHTWNYKLFANNKIRHHLLEIILWPNEDGTLTKIINSAERLKELGIYDDYKMTIEISNSEHTTLHNKAHSVFKNSEVQRQNGKKGAAAIKRKVENGELSYKGENNPMYGKDAWAIACSRKTPEQIEATRKSKSEKMKVYWMKKRQEKEVCHDANHI